jgi:BNR repeat-like domain
MKTILLLLTLVSTMAFAQSNKIAAKQTILFDGHEGFKRGDLVYRLACNALISQASNGDLFVTWLTGTDKEPSNDNCVMVAKSADGGKSWSEPTIIIPAGKMASNVTNFFNLDDGTMVIFGAYWPAEKLYTEWHYFKITSSDNGKTWSKQQKFSFFPNNAASLGGNPIKLDNGKYLMIGSCFEKRPYPLVAPIKMLREAKNEQEALAMLPIPGRSSHKMGVFKHGCFAAISNSQDMGNMKLGRPIFDRPLGLVEPTIMKLKDGSLVMLMRADYDQWLWRAESKDNGKTWSKAYRTDIPNPGALTDLIRLKDGRIALIHNPAPHRRNPMSIWISNDEMKSWYIKQDLIFVEKKDGRHGLAYPNAIITQEGKLCFVYDKGRREVCFVEVNIPPSKTKK